MKIKNVSDLIAGDRIQWKNGLDLTVSGIVKNDEDGEKIVKMDNSEISFYLHLLVGNDTVEKI